MAFRVFDSSIRKTYKSSICSKATAFLVISSLLSFLIPLLVCFKIQGFWKKHDTYREKPHVYFKHQLILNVETNVANKPIIWTTFPAYNVNLKPYFRPIMIENYEEDIDNDGRNDLLKINITVPVTENEDITSVKLILFFQYKLFSYSRFEMESLSLIQDSTRESGAKFLCKGDLRIYQKEALKHNSAEFKYNTSIVGTNSEFFNLQKLIHSYSTRNVTTKLENVYQWWITNRALNQPFKIEAQIFYPEETYLYKLGFWQLIKWAWIQYVSLLTIFLFVSFKVKLFVFENQVFKTIVETPFKPHIL